MLPHVCMELMGSDLFFLKYSMGLVVLGAVLATAVHWVLARLRA